ncbi:MAG TPA: hypothetical protein VK831_07015, partial [Candidatus Deferrimicrobiaceae bacterium]|nr:hypothetical protein [Candidatus Deferrimicrobiaceae bacterium]
MRSFLRFLIFITVLVAALVVVGGPLVARPLIAALVRDALPFDEDEVTVGVDVGPALFAGEVEVVSVSGRDLDSGEATIGLLEVTVTGLSIVDRSFRDIDGRLEAVELRFDDGTSVSFEHIEVSGPSNALRATATLDEVAVERLVLGKLADQGIEADAVRLGDEQIEIDALGMTETAR